MGGGQFHSTVALQLYDMLGIRKERIDSGEPWENYAETLLYVMWNLENSLHNLHYVDLTLDSYGVFKSNERQFHIISIQRRLADHAFSNARTWPEINRPTRRGGTTTTVSTITPIVSARTGGTARLRSCVGCWAHLPSRGSCGHGTRPSLPANSTGMECRFKQWRFFGENGLAGEEVSVWVYEDTLKVEHQATTLSLYSVRLSPDQRQITSVSNARRLETHFRSPQLDLWQLSETEWLLALRRPEQVARKKSRNIIPFARQLPLPFSRATS